MSMSTLSTRKRSRRDFSPPPPAVLEPLSDDWSSGRRPSVRALPSGVWRDRTLRSHIISFLDMHTVANGTERVCRAWRTRCLVTGDIDLDRVPDDQIKDRVLAFLGSHGHLVRTVRWTRGEKKRVTGGGSGSIGRATLVAVSRVFVAGLSPGLTSLELAEIEVPKEVEWPPGLTKLDLTLRKPSAAVLATLRRPRLSRLVDLRLAVLPSKNPDVPAMPGSAEALRDVLTSHGPALLRLALCLWLDGDDGSLAAEMACSGMRAMRSLRVGELRSPAFGLAEAAGFLDAVTACASTLHEISLVGDSWRDNAGHVPPPRSGTSQAQQPPAPPRVNLFPFRQLTSLRLPVFVLAEAARQRPYQAASLPLVNAVRVDCYGSSGRGVVSAIQAALDGLPRVELRSLTLERFFRPPAALLVRIAEEMARQSWCSLGPWYLLAEAGRREFPAFRELCLSQTPVGDEFVCGVDDALQGKYGPGECKADPVGREVSVTWLLHEPTEHPGDHCPVSQSDAVCKRNGYM